MPDHGARSLSHLRAMIDAVDREVLQLLARRMAIVGEVAGHKRAHGIRIRDLGREREVLDERRRRAEELGLPPGVIESVYRLVLLASRDRQAQLRTELPLEVEPRTVAVIGGRGGMGRCMADLFADLGHEVMVADLQSPVTPVEAAAAADVVVVSVPIADTEAVIREVGPHVRDDALLMDVTSVKTAPVRTMLEVTRAAVVGTHPMFGPGVHTLQGQRVIVCPGRGDAWLQWVQSMLSARGLVVHRASPEEHDRVMAIVQVLNHYHTQVLGLTLARLDTPLARTLEFTSPAYLLELYVTARHFAQSAGLYGPIEMLNPRTAVVTDAYQRAAREVADLLAARDQERFVAMFEEVRGFFGEFTDEALQQSSFLIDRLIELTAGRPGPGSGPVSAPPAPRR